MTTTTHPTTPSRSLGRRMLRALIVIPTMIVTLLAAAFVTGQLMLASHADPETIYTVGVGAAAVVILAGVGVIARSGSRR